jgi:hemerythrin superfamily protein
MATALRERPPAVAVPSLPVVVVWEIQMAANDAIALLKADHKEVAEMLEKFETARSTKGKLAQQICQALTVHAEIEEEIFYPAAREALGDEGKDLLDEAKVEHNSLKELIGQIEGSDPADDLFDAHVKVLGEYVKHHVKEEEGELFPKLRKSDMDLADVGARLAARKKELMAQMKAAA